MLNMCCVWHRNVHTSSCHCRQGLSDKKKKTDACKKKRKIFFIHIHKKESKKEREREKKKDTKRKGMRSLRKRELPRAVKVINHHCFLAQYTHKRS